MSSRNRNVPVTMVRIIRQEKPAPSNYTKDVTIGMPKDDETNEVYLRIAVDKKTMLSEPLENFQWLDQSSSAGVVTLKSESMTIIIIYNDKDQPTIDLFDELYAYYHDQEKEKPSTAKDGDEDQVDDLIKAIRNGSSGAAERAAKQLAKNRTKIQFHLSNIRDTDDEKSNKKTKTSPSQGSPDILKLQLQVESHLNRDPLVETIYVRSGTSLRDLKDQIEDQIGIKMRDQYWFASGRYMIDDNYVFGSDKPVASSCSSNKGASKKGSTEQIIKSGDTLIMFIAQILPFN